jgi:hypothetical protein
LQPAFSRCTLVLNGASQFLVEPWLTPLPLLLLHLPRLLQPNHGFGPGRTLHLLETCVLTKLSAGVDWHGAPPPVWLELVAPLFWMGPAMTVDVWAGWWSCTLGVFLKVWCFGSSAMVGSVWVDGW